MVGVNTNLGGTESMSPGLFNDVSRIQTKGKTVQARSRMAPPAMATVRAVRWKDTAWMVRW